MYEIHTYIENLIEGKRTIIKKKGSIASLLIIINSVD